MAREFRGLTVSATHASERPRTSAGRTGPKPVERPDFSKRVSRDDLALTLKQSRREDPSAYHVPVRGRLPFSELGMRSHSLEGSRTRDLTPASSARDKDEMGVIAIGMALGSPTVASPQRTPTRPRLQRAMTAAVETVEEPLEESPKKDQKARKWGLFRSKSKRSRPADASVPPRSMTDISNVSTSSLSSAGVASVGAPNAVSFRYRGPIDQPSRPVMRPKTPISRSQTEPNMVERIDTRDMKPSAEKIPPMPRPAEPKTPKESRSGGLVRKVSLRGLRGEGRSKKAEKQIRQESPPPVPKLNIPAPTLMDVEIPSVKMERYSVMFNGVLQSQGSSSLLSRRQATLERLKTAGDSLAESQAEEVLMPPRRATSPQLRNSPNFSLFPGAPKSDKFASPMISPRLRANTSPAAFPSPVESTFEEHPPPRKQQLQEVPRARVVQVSGSRDPSGSRKSSKGSKSSISSTGSGSLVSNFNKSTSASTYTTQLPKTSSKQVHPRRVSPAAAAGLVAVPRSKSGSRLNTATSSLVLDSPEPSDDEGSPDIRQPRPLLIDPQWNMISPPASVESSSPRTARKKTPPLVDTKAAKVPPMTESDRALRNAVEDSIARQINSSYRQRQMLHPLKSNPSVGKRNGNPTPHIKIPVGRHECLSQTKSATPTVVHPEDVAASPQTWHMHRKSARVVLESYPN